MQAGGAWLFLVRGREGKRPSRRSFSPEAGTSLGLWPVGGLALVWVASWRGENGGGGSWELGVERLARFCCRLRARPRSVRCYEPPRTKLPSPRVMLDACSWLYPVFLGVNKQAGESDPSKSSPITLPTQPATLDRRGITSWCVDFAGWQLRLGLARLAQGLTVFLSDSVHCCQLQ